MKYQVIANWKSNLIYDQVLDWMVKFQKTSPDLLETLDVILAPGFTELPIVQQYLANWNLEETVKLAAQDLSPFSPGAYTGEITAEHLASYNVQYVIIGHSERRQNFHVDDGQVVQKIRRALQKQLNPIVAVSNLSQVRDLTENLDPPQLAQLLFAYEPIESIGTGHPADPNQVQRFFNEILDLQQKHGATATSPVIYGGSVDDQTVKQYLKLDHLAGFLVGGASDRAESFQKLLQSISS